PLSAITTGAGLLLQRGRLDDSDDRTVARIITASRRMAKMVTQLLDLTRARLGGGLLLKVRASALREICRSVLDEFEPGRARRAVARRHDHLRHAAAAPRAYRRRLIFFALPAPSPATLSPPAFGSGEGSFGTWPMSVGIPVVNSAYSVRRGLMMNSPSSLMTYSRMSLAWLPPRILTTTIILRSWPSIST